MRTYLTHAEADAIAARAAALEAQVGVPVVTAVVAKADHYVELPWKAFALGAVFAALGVVAVDALRPDWASAHAAVLHTVTILGTGAASALLAVFVLPYARLLLTRLRRDSEVRHCAEAMFLRRELAAGRRAAFPPRQAGSRVAVAAPVAAEVRAAGDAHAARPALTSDAGCCWFAR